MTDTIPTSASGPTFLLRRSKYSWIVDDECIILMFRSSLPTFRFKPPVVNSQTKLKRQPTVVLLVDEVCSIPNWFVSLTNSMQNCPVHGCKGKCSCPTESNNQGDLGNADSLYQSGYNNEEKRYENYENSNEFTSTTIKPFNNNPPLPYTQKYDIEISWRKSRCITLAFFLLKEMLLETIFNLIQHHKVQTWMDLTMDN